MQTLTRSQKTILAAATIPMAAAGAVGAWGTYANIVSVFHRKGTAAGVVAAGEGAVLVLALVLVGLTMLGQAAPLIVRAGLWLLPASASITGMIVAPSAREAVVFAVTPMAMTVSAEGLGLLARRIVVHQTGTDVEAQRRNAATLRRIAYHRARAERHPWTWVQRWSALRAWRLMARVGEGDTQLGTGLITVQRERLTDGASAALGEMLPGLRELPVGGPVSRKPETTEPEPSPDSAGFDDVVETALVVAAPGPTPEPNPGPVLGRDILHTLLDLPVHREPVLSPAEPTVLTTPEPAPAPVRETRCEPEPDEREQQITELATRLRQGERLTKSTAAELLGVSPATAGRRLKEARDRIDDGTGMYL